MAIATVTDQQLRKGETLAGRAQMSLRQPCSGALFSRYISLLGCHTVQIAIGKSRSLTTLAI